MNSTMCTRKKCGICQNGSGMRKTVPSCWVCGKWIGIVQYWLFKFIKLKNATNNSLFQIYLFVFFVIEEPRQMPLDILAIMGTGLGLVKAPVVVLSDLDQLEVKKSENIINAGDKIHSFSSHHTVRQRVRQDCAVRTGMARLSAHRTLPEIRCPRAANGRGWTAGQIGDALLPLHPAHRFRLHQWVMERETQYPLVLCL